VLADGLSTALSALPPSRLPHAVDQYLPVKAHLVDSKGIIRELGATELP
jgi:thiamine biosynthesis lipoprotein ApbE